MGGMNGTVQGRRRGDKEEGVKDKSDIIKGKGWIFSSSGPSSLPDPNGSSCHSLMVPNLLPVPIFLL